MRPRNFPASFTTLSGGPIRRLVAKKGGAMTSLTSPNSIVGEPEVVEDASTAETSAAWLDLKAAVTELQTYQMKDGSIPDSAAHQRARNLVGRITADILHLAPAFPSDSTYLETLVVDFEKWADGGFGVPDFYDSLVAFAPAQRRDDGLRHLVV